MTGIAQASARQERAVTDPNRARRLTDPTVVLALAAILLGTIWGAFLLAPDAPGDDSAEAGFARDMAVHHAQAVEMALIIRDITQDQNLRYIATDIILTQQAQIGQMRGWLDAWGLPPNGHDLPMTWMGHPTAGLMPGMASAEEIDRLRALPAGEAEALFLELMIRHHQSGIDMADGVLELSDRAEVRQLAQAIETSQQIEIDAMQAMLQERGLPTMPAEPPTTAGHAAEHGHLEGHGSLGDVLGSILAAGPIVLALFALAWLVLDALRRLPEPPRLLAGEADLPDPVWQAVAGAGLLLSGLIHAGLTPHHFEEAASQGIFFAVATILLVVIGSAILAWPSSPWYLAGLISSAGLIAVYILFRLVPAPGSEAVEDIDAIGLITLATQLAAALACALLWREQRGQSILLEPSHEH